MRIGLLVGILSVAISGCGNSGIGGNGTGGSTSPVGSSGGVGLGGSSSSSSTPATGGSSSVVTSSNGGASAGSTAAGGQTGGTTGVTVSSTSSTAGQAGGATGGSSKTGGTTGAAGQTGTGGQAGGATGGSTKTGGTTGAAGQTGTGGRAGGATGGSTQTAGTTGTGSQPDGGLTNTCVPTKTFTTVDPTMAGPFTVKILKDIGPENGNADAKWNNQKPHFNLYLPQPLGGGYCHPVVTWSNGTGDQPPTYEVLIKQLASHGFVVVASLSSQTAAGTPIPPIAGVDWMVEQNDDAKNEFGLYHNLDITKIGATGHSQGGAATTMAGGDPRVTATAPICGSRANITMHGPAILICGGADTMVPCSSVLTAFNSITTVPVMLAEMAGTTHGSWIGSIKDPVMVATTGWMRVHLMNDTANRGWFYGANCKACTDSKWKVQRKMMDQ
jgi:dienelactone hydrolase